MTIIDCENRFKEISGIDIDLTKDLIKKTDFDVQQTKTNKQKSDEFGEVFTPLYLVDLMIELKFSVLAGNSTTCDLCAGYGQFTIRLMRKLYNRLHINIEKWLEKYHTFTELQLESCAKLVYIFGPNINLYVGDSKNLKYAKSSEYGILFFNEKEKQWKNNELLNELLKFSIVQNNLKLLIKIFEISKNKNKLLLLKDKLNKKGLLNESY